MPTIIIMYNVFVLNLIKQSTCIEQDASNTICFYLFCLSFYHFDTLVIILFSTQNRYYLYISYREFVLFHVKNTNMLAHAQIFG